MGFQNSHCRLTFLKLKCSRGESEQINFLSSSSTGHKRESSMQASPSREQQVPYSEWCPPLPMFLDFSHGYEYPSTPRLPFSWRRLWGCSDTGFAWLRGFCTSRRFSNSRFSSCSEPNTAETLAYDNKSGLRCSPSGSLSSVHYDHPMLCGGFVTLLLRSPWLSLCGHCHW